MDGVKASNPVCSICHVAWRRLDDGETRVEGDGVTLGFEQTALIFPRIQSVFTEGNGFRVLQHIRSKLEIAAKRRKFLLVRSGLFISKDYLLCSDSLRAGRSGDRIPLGNEIFCTRPDGPWGPPSPLYQYFSTFVRPRPGKFFFIRRGPGPNK
jgi:hypothetical protein